MDFLQLCQRLRQEVGGSGDGPPSVLNQQGENRLYVTWVNQAWQEIQNYRTGWNFHWAELSLPIDQGASVLTLPDDLRTLVSETLHIGGQLLQALPWARMREIHRGTLTEGRPSAWSQAPNGQLYLNAAADDDYVLGGEYYIKPQALAENDDVPLLPERYHMLIVYKAMMLYAAYENAPDIYAAAQIVYQQMLADMDHDELPAMEFAGPLA